MRHSSRNRWKSGDRSGAVALEAALILPALLWVMTGMVDLCWIYHVRQTMMFAAREGARELSLQGATLTEATNVARNYLTQANITTATITGQNAFSGNGNGSDARRVWIEIRLASSAAIISGDPFNIFASMGPLVVRVNMRKEGELLPP